MTLPKPEIGAPCNGCGLCCRIEVCSAGSSALGLVARYGERAPGPCPALTADGERQVCGLVRRPKDHLPGNAQSLTRLRAAATLMIGAGLGCDEAGDEPDETAMPKLAALQQRFVAEHAAEVPAAARVLFAHRLG